MRKVFLAIFVFGFLFLLFGFTLPTFAAQKLGGLEINFFYSLTCPHCAKEEKFLDDLEKKYPEIEIKKFSVSQSSNLELLKEFYRKYQVPSEYYGMVPATFTNSRYFIGFSEEISRGIEECILECQKDIASGENASIIDLEGNISIPFLGEINLKQYSLSLLAIVLGFLDGFNVCSLGALFLILALVLTLKSRKKTLLFGGLFILTTAIVYGFLIVLWYQLFSFFLPYLKIMEVLIGILGIAGGIYFFRQFLKYRKKGAVCETGTAKKITEKFSSKFQKSIQKSKNIFFLLGAVFLFAAVLTIVEFPCSAVVPVAFAGVLARSGLVPISYFFYIALFIVFYLLDEIVVFLVAFLTTKLWLSSAKFQVWLALAEAIILFLLGLYYLI